MGMGSLDLKVLCWLKEKGYLANQMAVMEIGAQQLANNFLTANNYLNKIANLFNIQTPAHFCDPIPTTIVHGQLEHQSEKAPYSREFWRWLGYTHAAIDIDESPGSIALDLNYDEIPEALHGKYQLVTNQGTTEHVANQLNAFKIIHDLTANDGLMYHIVPSQGMLNHGLVNYNPKFFWMLARSNGYKWVYCNYLILENLYQFPQNIVDNIAEFEPDIAKRCEKYSVGDTCIVVVLQKKFDIDFVSPIDVPTGTKTKHRILQKRYWTVFEDNAFANYLARLEKERQVQAEKSKNPFKFYLKRMYTRFLKGKD